VHGFAQDANGELYALATNTSANGNGGVVYKLVSVRLSFQVSGNQEDLSWPIPGGHLQSQTNSLGTNWVTVPGSDTTNNIVVPIDPANAPSFTAWPSPDCRARIRRPCRNPEWIHGFMDS
jgi:hypothetical protein